MIRCHWKSTGCGCKREATQRIDSFGYCAFHAAKVYGLRRWLVEYVNGRKAA
jgi:hypothetical protein